MSRLTTLEAICDEPEDYVEKVKAVRDFINTFPLTKRTFPYIGLKVAKWGVDARKDICLD
ncbi:hypothetical protein [Vibrio phage vB_VhaP_PG11]|nr:hypothetical protein [Vibrio phage vB_VhaP_PG11]